MSAERILAESWQLFRAHWRYLGVIAAINLVVALILSVTVTFFGVTSLISLAAHLLGGGSPQVNVAIFLAFLALLAALLAPILTGASAAAAKAVLGNKAPRDVSLPYRQSVAAYTSLLPVTLVAGSAIIVGFILLVIPGLVALVAFAPALYLVLAEGGTPGAVLARSIELARAHAVTLCLLLIALGLLSMLSSWLLGGVPRIGDLLAGYGQSLIAVFSMLTIAVFHRHATRPA